MLERHTLIDPRGVRTSFVVFGDCGWTMRGGKTTPCVPLATLRDTYSGMVLSGATPEGALTDEEEAAVDLSIDASIEAAMLGD